MTDFIWKESRAYVGMGDWYGHVHNVGTRSGTYSMLDILYITKKNCVLPLEAVLWISK